MPSEPPKFAKGSCLHCAGHFEFEESAAGGTITCPHCGHETPLFSLAISFDALPSPTAVPATVSEASPQPAPASDADVGLARYFSGGAVRLGDRVRFRDSFATVVFVSNGEREACLPGYEDYAGHDAGIVICDDDGETSLLREEDPDLEMVHH